MRVPDPEPGNRAEWMEAATSPMMLGLILSAHHGWRCLENQPFTPYEHIQELDAVLTALCDGRLWESGPGPAPAIRAKYRPIKGRGPLREVVHQDWWDMTDDDGRLVDEKEWVLHSAEPFHPAKPGESIVHRLGVFLPIRHGKSLMCSLLLPVWYVLQNPATAVLIVGHTKDFGQGELGRRVQSFLGNYMATLGLVCADPRLSRDKMNFKYQGAASTITFSGVDVGVLGLAKRLGILDDPVKSMKDMMSEPFRDRQNQFYADEWLGRATMVPGLPPPADVNVMSRIGLDDIGGVHIVRPGTFAEPQRGYYVLHRAALVKDEHGEHALCEGMVTTDRLREAREKTPETFQSQYQNDPRPVRGLGFPPLSEWPKWRRRSSTHDGMPVYSVKGVSDEIVPHTRFASIDLSGKATNRSDYTVVAIFDYSLTFDLLLLRDLKRMRLDAADHMAMVRQLCHVDGERPPEYAVTENVALSYNLLQSAERDPDYLGFDVRASNRPGGSTGPKALSKVQRFRLYADAAEAGRVALPDEVFDLAWWLDFKAEHETWPKTAHDDQLDACADGVFEASRIKEDNPVREDERPRRVADGGRWVYNAGEQPHVRLLDERVHGGSPNPLGSVGGGYVLGM